MKFVTSITDIKNNQEIIRGFNLQKLIEQKSFVETIFLILKGNLPKNKEQQMLNAILVSAIDHGPGTASAMTSRIVAAAKNNLHTSLAAGILAMGERHGGATEKAALFFQENIKNKNIENLLKELKDKKIRVPGYGHAILKKDERTTKLLIIAKKIGFYGQHVELALKVEKIINKISSKEIPLNIDGTIAAILSDMYFAPLEAKGIFIIARVPGLVAQILEEMDNDTGIKRLSQDEIEFKNN